MGGRCRLGPHCHRYHCLASRAGLPGCPRPQWPELHSHRRELYRLSVHRRCRLCAWRFRVDGGGVPVGPAGGRGYRCSSSTCAAIENRSWDARADFRRNLRGRAHGGLLRPVHHRADQPGQRRTRRRALRAVAVQPAWCVRGPGGCRLLRDVFGLPANRIRAR